MVNVDNFFTCLVCKSNDVTVSQDRWKCNICDHVYPVIQGIPILVLSWEQHQERLDAACAAQPAWYNQLQLSEETSPWRHHLKKRRHFVMAALARYLKTKGQPQAKNLLDLGCGEGHHLHYLIRYAEQVFGCDYNIIRLVRARQQWRGIPLFLADILNFPAKDDFFEIIFFNHVLEHIGADEQALATVFRILQPGGLLVLGVPNEGAWWWQLAYKLQPRTLQQTDHVQFYTAASLTRKLKSQGFRLLDIVHLGWGPPHWTLDAWLRRFRIMDDLWEMAGKRWFPNQASSLYALASKQ